MALVAGTVAVAILAGWLRGGRLRHLAAVSVRARWAVAVAVGAQALLAALGATGGWPARTLVAVAQGALLVFLVANRRLPGMSLVALGSAANAAVILVNGAMPVSAAAARVIDPAASVDTGPHRVLSPGDRLAWLADVIPVPPLATVVSIGDVVLAIGVAVLVSTLMRDPDGAPADPQARSSAGRPT